MTPTFEETTPTFWETTPNSMEGKMERSRRT
jgi:hypothetical protein